MTTLGISQAADYISQTDIPIGSVCNKSCVDKEFVDKVAEVAYNDTGNMVDIIHLLKDYGYERQEKAI